MLGISHMKIALGISLFTANPDFIIGSVIGSLLPDVDKQTTYLGRYNFFLKSKSVRKVIQHRGVTHSIFGTLVTIAILKLLFNRTSLMGISFGIITHLIADSFTPMGIQLWWLPNQSDSERRKKRVVLGRMKTGGLLEWVISNSIFLAGLVAGLVTFVRSIVYV